MSHNLCFRLLCYAVPVATFFLARDFLPVGICDDAFISFKVAVNTAAGRGMDYRKHNPRIS